MLTRLLQAASVVGVVVTLCFFLIRVAPGDPFFSGLDEPGVPVEAAAAMREQFGYDKPVATQYVRYIGGVVRGDFGWSHSRARPVSEVIGSLLPNTLLLAGTGLFFGLVFGVLIGTWQGWRAETLLSRASDRALLIITSVPEFVLALGLAMLFALHWKLLPVSGMRAEGVTAFGDVARHLVLPAGTIALAVAAVIARHQRASMRIVRDAEFMRAARASGVSEGRLVRSHALRNAIAPVLTVFGVLLGGVASGTVLIERIFDWPGMGRAILEAVGQRDYPLVAGAVLVTSLVVVAATLLADLALAWADPRLRRSL